MTDDSQTVESVNIKIFVFEKKTIFFKICY